MVEKRPASRSILQATYTPIKLPERRPTRTLSPISGKATKEKRPPRKAWVKWRFLVELDLKPDEAQEILRQLRVQKVKKKPQQLIIEETVRNLRMLMSFLPEMGTSRGPKLAQLLANMSPESLILIAEKLVELRSHKTTLIKDDMLRLRDAFLKSIVPSKKLSIKPPKGWKLLGRSPNRIKGDIFVFEHEEWPPQKEMKRLEEIEKGQLAVSRSRVFRHIRSAVVIPADVEELKPPNERSVLELNVGTVVDWAQKNKIEVDSVKAIIAKLESIGFKMTIPITTFLGVMDNIQDMFRQLLQQISEYMKIEPVGYLHLEKLEFVPVGFERGELVYSLPLAPGEQVNIAHKEWSNTEEEYERIVQDYLEAYSEEGVVENSELAISTNSEHQHSSAFNTGVTASGEYGPVRVSTTIGYDVQNSETESVQESRNRSSQLTRKASARTKTEHKISFKVASASGVEDQQVRKIVNPDPNRPTRIDYYQLIRKWKVNLYRYGLRLTYDIAIPEPGSDILSKIVELQQINNELEKGFEFPLHPFEFDRYTFPHYAAQYDVVVDVPPDNEITIEEVYSKNYNSFEESEKDSGFHSFEVKVPDDYYVISTEGSYADYSAWQYGPMIIIEHDFLVYPYTDLQSWVTDSQSGTLHVSYYQRNCSTIFFKIRLKCRLKQEVLAKWHFNTWEKFRAAAEKAYLERRQMLKERRTRLTEELGIEDALSLRKFEREEVMKNVLRWMLGPLFVFHPPTLPPNLYTENASVNSSIWIGVMIWGEFIKFLHHAVEWENVLYFLYPYFWSHRDRWELKKYLHHPDAMHKTFLKAGSARVVLTIRPGFEQDFLSLMDSGGVGLLTESDAYFSIADEMRAFAETNYPGIPAANPVSDARPLIYPKQKKAWEDMQKLTQLLEAFHADNDRYPEENEGLAALAPHVNAAIPNVPLTDPWGNDFDYTFPGVYSDYDLVSYGADGQPGGEDENSDINSWASASLVGTWFEYTPASALDIRMGDEMPEG